ncbi:head maturation protease [Gordonia phage Catfish]|uniref:Capsid maturation protease n=1 Tax=Gordonia phage Catfish TaxID=2301538 RepID=A0A385D0U0_9CAUD|nr:head maturation protease [Gordonia phage Catfish]AXQ51845.1 capsid maturation protease [Gordonia phage Catfish]
MKTKVTELVGIKTDETDEGLGEGEFIGYASVFGNRDSYGDVVEKGAFTDTLEAWGAKSGQSIPLYWAHNTSDPDYNIGHVVKGEQDDVGLKVHVKIDLESPKGATVYRLIKQGRVNQMSFMYEVEDGEFVTPIDSGGAKDYAASYYSLKKLKVHEVSVVQVGANQSTEILDVKEHTGELLAKAGRTLSSKNEDALRGVVQSLKSALEAVNAVLPPEESGDEGENDEGEDAEKSAVAPAVKASLELELLALKR